MSPLVLFYTSAYKNVSSSSQSLIKLGGSVGNQWKIVLLYKKQNTLRFIKGFVIPLEYWSLNLAMYFLVDWLCSLKNYLKSIIFIPLGIR